MVEIHAEDWDTDDTDQTGYYGSFSFCRYLKMRMVDTRMTRVGLIITDY